MLGELQSIYDEKSGLHSQLNKLTQDWQIEGSDGIGLEEVKMVETPTSLGNDLQLRQMLSNMQKEFNDIDESNDELNESSSIVLAENYKDIGE